MPEFCDVALPVPLDMVFSYRVPAEVAAVVGSRVLVPFRQQRMTGVVVELHDRKPTVKIKNILSVLDASPVLDEQLLRLGRWIADYYLAPLGEVFRTMLPLNAEFKRGVAYRISAEGRKALHLAGISGSSARSRRTPEEQAAEFRVLDYLAAQEPALGETVQVREETLRSTTSVTKALLAGMVRKKWLGREAVAEERDARRLEKMAVLNGREEGIGSSEPKPTVGGRLPRLKNFNVAVREWNEQIVFLRKIVEGGTDKSYGIQVARLAGVPKPVLERAKEILRNLEESELTPDGNVRQQARQRAEREKLQKLAPPPQMDLFGQAGVGGGK